MIRYFINNGIAVTVLCIAVVLFGALALVSLPIQLTPNVTTPAITVSTFYPGATPDDVEQDIIAEQEKFLRGVPGLKKMTSTAGSGSAQIILEFAVGSEMSENLVRVNNALSQVASYPENVDQPSLSTSSASDQPVAWFSLRAAPGRETEIDTQKEWDFAEDNVKARFERIPGVAAVEGVYGGSPKEMQVFIDPTKLAERGITIYQVREAIRTNNRDISGGSLDEGKRRYNVRTTGRFRSPLDVENTIITVKEGGPVYIRDIGYARVAIAEERSVIRHNGRPALALGVRHQPGTNLLVVMEEVKRVAAELNETTLKSRGLFLTQVTDDTEYVRAAVAMVRDNLMTGSVLSLLTLLLFLRHLRSTLIIGVSIPLCLFGSLAMIEALGRSINVVTLAGLAFSVGSVLDNSIVVLENIYRHRQMGKDAVKAAFDGVEEVWTAVLSSAGTNVIVFLPIIRIEEQAGQLFRDLAIAITATNVFSMMIAVLVVPCMAAVLLHVLPHAPQHGWRKRAYELWGLAAIAGRWNTWLGEILHWLMKGNARRLGVVGGMVAVALVLGFLFLPKTEYLPEGNQNSVFGMMFPPQGYNLKEMSAIGSELEQRLRPHVEASMEDYRAGKIDGPPIRDFFFVGFDQGMFIFTRGKDDALASKVPPLLLEHMSEVPGVIPIATQRSIFDSSIEGSRGLELDIIGPDTTVCTGIAAQAFFKIMSELHTFPRPEPGIEIGQPQLTITPNWTRAAELGISATAIGYGAWVLGDGAYADDYYEDGKKYDLYMYSTMGAFDTLSSFDTLRIATDEGDTVPLSSVADVGFTFVPQAIRRVDQRRAVTLNVIPPADKSLEETIGFIQTKIIDELKSQGAVPPGYEIRIGGSSDKLSAIRDSLKGDFILAIVLVYLVLVLIFRHWGHPLTIMLSVPIGLTGGILGLKVLNWYLGIVSPGTIQSLDVLTMLGFVILLGSVVNNPILIVEQALNFMEQGMERHEAIVQSTLTRIRPILMTTGTTILGLLPLVALPGAGSELYRGLGVVTFGGLLFGTVTTIFFIPSVMSLVLDLGDWLHHTAFGSSTSKVIRRLQEGPED
jgi:HAE1 family hydrophobic/amphiphilic exporter-1